MTRPSSSVRTLLIAGMCLLANTAFGQDAPSDPLTDVEPSAESSEMLPTPIPQTPRGIAFEPHPEPLLPTEATALTFYVLGPGGRPLAEADVEGTADGGSLGEIVEVRPGVYRVMVTPQQSPSAPTEVVVQVSAMQGTITERLSLATLLQQPPQIAVTMESEEILLGTVESIDFELDTHVAGWPEPALDEVQVQSNVGRIVGLKALGEGRFSGTYVLPESRAPQVAVIGVAVSQGPFFRWGWSRIIMPGTKDQIYAVDPGATVYAKVGGRRFGPVRAGADGRASLSLEVRPGQERVDVETRSGAGGVANVTSPLILPPFPRAVLMAGAKETVPSGEEKLVVFAVESTGAPRPLDVGALKVDGGDLLLVRAPEPGVLLARYRTPAQAGVAQISLSEDVLGKVTAPEPVEFSVPAGRASKLKMKLQPDVLRVDDPPAQVEVQILDERGLPAGGGRLVLETSLGEVSRPSQVAAGTMVAALTPPRDLTEQGVVESGAVDGSVKASLFWFEGAGAPSELRVQPPVLVMDPALHPDGLEIAVRLLDPLGLPLGRHHINGQVLAGGGTFSGGVTDSGGWVAMVYRPDSAVDGISRLKVLVEARPRLQRDLIVFVSPGGDESFERPAAGLVPGAPDLTAEAELRIKAGRVKQVHVTVQPNDLYIGVLDTADVRVRLIDGQGNSVIDPEMIIETDSGFVEGLRFEDGIHVATYRPPAELESPVASLTVRGGTEEFAGGTEIFLKERKDRILVSSRVGAISNLREYVAPLATLGVFRALPDPFVGAYGGVGLQYHPFTLAFEEPDGEGEGLQRSDILSLWAGGAYRAQLGPIAAKGVVALVGAGVFYSTTFADEQRSPTSLAIVPGLRVALEGEVGLGSGGLGAAISYTRINVNGLDLGPEGNLGGVSIEMGYVVHLR